MAQPVATPAFSIETNFEFNATSVPGLAFPENGVVAFITAGDGTISTVPGGINGKKVVPDNPASPLVIGINQPMDQVGLIAVPLVAGGTVTMMIVFKHKTTGNIFTQTITKTGQLGGSYSRGQADILGVVVSGASVDDLRFDEFGN